MAAFRNISLGRLEAESPWGRQRERLGRLGTNEGTVLPAAQVRAGRRGTSDHGWWSLRLVAEEVEESQTCENLDLFLPSLLESAASHVPRLCKGATVHLVAEAQPGSYPCSPSTSKHQGVPALSLSHCTH